MFNCNMPKELVFSLGIIITLSLDYNYSILSSPSSAANITNIKMSPR